MTTAVLLLLCLESKAIQPMQKYVFFDNFAGSELLLMVIQWKKLHAMRQIIVVIMIYLARHKVKRSQRKRKRLPVQEVIVCLQQLARVCYAPLMVKIKRREFSIFTIVLYTGCLAASRQ